MTLQSPELVMAGLGIENDIPPNHIQPKLNDGIHLRWSFQSHLGFPWYGFYLFRRPHRPGIRNSMHEMLKNYNLQPGVLPQKYISLEELYQLAFRNVTLKLVFQSADSKVNRRFARLNTKHENYTLDGKLVLVPIEGSVYRGRIQSQENLVLT